MRRGTREPCTLKGPWHAVPPAPSRHHGAPRCSNCRHLPHHRCCRLLVPKATRMPILRTLIELARQDEAMGKKPAGAGAGAGWLATVRKVFKPASKDMRHAKKQRGGELVDGGGDAAEVVSVEHFPAAETSPEVTNEAIGTVVWLDREGYGEVEGARRQHRGVAAAAAASRVARAATTRGMTGGREERAAVRIQAFYRGYLARRALRALRGLVRLQALVRGHQVRRQVHRTMRCMQALVRAQDRFRARRLVTSPYAGRPVVAQRHPTSLLVGPGNRHALAHRQHGGRRSFGHDRVGFDDVHLDDRDMAMAQAHSSVSHYALQGTWDAVRADGMLLRQHDTAAARGETIDPAYAYEFQHRRRQTEELQERDNKRNAGSRQHWMDVSHAGLQSHQRHAPERTNNHGAAETSYVTAAATDGVSENTVEMDQEAARKNPTRDLYPAVRSPVIPGYMAATESARAKARTATPPAVASRAHARTRSGSAAANGNSSTLAANLGWGLSHSNGGGGVGAPESSCSSDRTPPTLGERSRQAPA